MQEEAYWGNKELVKFNRVLVNPKGESKKIFGMVSGKA
jgi:hypothetical protein